MDYLKRYQEWLESDEIDEETKEELRKIKNDETEIKDSFYKDLEFGTAGLRGIVGVGTNRMNKYTVGKATQGLANYIVKNNGHLTAFSKNRWDLIGFFNIHNNKKIEKSRFFY